MLERKQHDVGVMVDGQAHNLAVRSNMFLGACQLYHLAKVLGFMSRSPVKSFESSGHPSSTASKNSPLPSGMKTRVSVHKPHYVCKHLLAGDLHLEM